MPTKRYGTSPAARRAALCAISALACVLLAPMAQAQTIKTFKSTGAEQAFSVPNGVTHINVLAIGEAGGGGAGAGAGGLPAEARGEVSVTPGKTLFVEVAKGTFNGGGALAGETNNGGGASDVRTSKRAAGLSPDTRFIVAGGGGGGGEGGGAGAGGNAGEPGKNAETVAGFPTTAKGGGAGTLTGGGAGGLGVGGGNGEAGTLGSGGSGGVFNASVGGGGGGGYYGGGGGGSGDEIGLGSGGGGGGGGSSLVPAGGSMTLASLGTKPVVQITYTRPHR